MRSERSERSALNRTWSGSNSPWITLVVTQISSRGTPEAAMPSPTWSSLP